MTVSAVRKEPGTSSGNRGGHVPGHPRNAYPLRSSHDCGRSADASATGRNRRLYSPHRTHGAAAVFLQNAFYEGEAIAYREGLSTAFLTDLGFTIPSALDRFVGDAEGSQAFMPLEQLSVLNDADVLIWGTEKDSDRVALEDEPLYRALTPVDQGRQVFTGGLLAGAIYFNSVLSLPFVLDRLVPALASTFGDDGPVTITVPRSVPE